MPLKIEEVEHVSENFSSLKQVLNAFAFQIKQITGKSRWNLPPSQSLENIQGTSGTPGTPGTPGDKGEQGIQGVKGDKGDTGAQGIQGLKGDKGDTGAQGEPAPLNHRHAVADVSGLQTALDAKAAINHNHLPSAWQNLPLNTGWANSGADYGYATAQYRLIGNLVELKGIIRKSSAFNQIELIAFLPVNHRPSQLIRFTTWGNAGTSQLQIGSNGALSLMSRDSTEISLNLLFGAD